MEKITLKEVSFNNTYFDKIQIILDDHGLILLLPFLWAVHVFNTGTIFKWCTRGNFLGNKSNSNFHKSLNFEKYLESTNVSENTIQNYLGHLFQFLKYLNQTNKSSSFPSLHNTELIDSKFINHYLNTILPEKLQSISSLKAHKAAISAYFTFLFDLGLKDYLNLTIYRKTYQLVSETNSKPVKINYLSKSERNSLIRVCVNQRDRLIIRMGYEVGLRAEENTGLILGDHIAKSHKNPGLLKLFSELSENLNKQSFEYTLNGKYTKGGKTRKIYFNRELLIALKHYYDTERLSILQTNNTICDTLFVRYDMGAEGLPIGASHASNVFNILKKQCPHINPFMSYHDLRHTFATELYHSELLSSDGNETRSESAALIVVAEQLGHKSTSSTTRYIRNRLQMLIIEDMAR